MHSLRTPKKPIHSVSASSHRSMYVTIDTQWVSALRALIVSTFKDVVSFIRIQPVDHAQKMKVCLGFTEAIEDVLMVSIIRTLPSAEFGRISIQ